MISVCMATYNGEKYIKAQIDSILIQLMEDDELIVSDDGSKDRTIDVIESFNDDRIKLFINNHRHGVAGNFENALNHTNGDIIFFSDQDDVWLPNKIKEMSDFLRESDAEVITCSCSLTDSDLNITCYDYYGCKNPLQKSAWGNFYKDLWLGCCMAFKRSVLKHVLPFPEHIVAHDLWIAIYAQLVLKCAYYPKPMQLYRRHEETVSFVGGVSTNRLSYKLFYRFYLAVHLIKRIFKYYINK